MHDEYAKIAEFYDLFAPTVDVPFYIDYARRYGSPVLDLAAGTGRVSIPLAIAGLSVTSLDRSPSMLAEMHRRMSSLPDEVRRRITIIEGDMTEFSLRRRFALVILSNSFAHLLTTERQLSMLRCVRRHLRPDGVFILDFYPAATMDEHISFEEPARSLPDGRMVSRSGVIDCDMARQIMTVHLLYRIVPSAMTGPHDPEVIPVMSTASLIFNREADLLVQTAGLYTECEFGDFDMRPYTPESSRRILVLKRKMTQRPVRGRPV